ncbi:MAG: hypothetical protein LUH63_20755 [Parabacteroides sp.]|nr:hypothetical protein [Parabacteroides sp.]
MKRKIQLCLLAFLAIAGIGWAITAETTITLTVDPNIQTDATNNQFKTLKEAVLAANENKDTNPIVIFVKNGDYNIARDDKTDGDGNYLAITRNKVTIEGQSKENVKIYSTTQSVNGNWVDQNLITIHGDNVAIKNATIVCKHEVNKVIEILGDNVTLENLVCNAPGNENFAGSIYFSAPADDTNKSLGTARLTNLVLNNGRITFTGVEKGSVVLNNITINYDKMTISHSTNMGGLQEYSPFGHVADRPNITITGGETVKVNVVCDENSYKADAVTMAHMPEGSTLSLPSQVSIGSDITSLKNIKLNFATGGLVIDKNDVTLENVSIIAATGNALVINNGKTGVTIKNGSCINTVEGKQGEGAIRFNGQNGTINVSGTTLTGGIFVDDCNGSLAGITGNTINFTYAGDTPLVGINVVCKTANKSNVGVTAQQLATANPSITMPAKGIQNKVLFQDENWAVYDGVAANSIISVADAEGLKSAIKLATAGQTIELTGDTYGSENAVQLFGTIKVPNLTIKAKDSTKKPKVYGTLKILAEGCTIDGLDMYTKSDGSAALKNVVDVVAMSTTITNNIFNMEEPTAGNVSNGLCIWPYGTAGKASYIVKGNSFNGFKATVTDWSSTAFTIAENLELSRFGFTSEQKSKVVTIDNEKELWTGNTFKDCFSDYVHSNWTSATVPVYSFVVISSNADALETAVEYSGDNAQVYLAGEYALTAPLAISKAINLQSADTTAAKRATIKGNITIEGDGVTLNGLKINTESTGTNYWLKNAVSVIGKSATVTNCDFTGSVQSEHGKEYVVNGIVLFPTATDAKYTVTGNTFTKFNAKLDDKGTASAAILMADGYTLTKKEGGTVALSAVTTYKEESISDANIYTDCYADYIHANYTDSENYLYSRISTPESALVSLLLTKTSGGTIQANGVTVKAVVDAMNNGTDKSDLSGADVVIECKDGVIATKASTAKQLAKEGKPALLLKQATAGSSNYTCEAAVYNDPTIINLPATVEYGTSPIKLEASEEGSTIAVKDGSTEYVKLENGLLSFLKPGEATLTITPTQKNGGSESYQQTVTITKRTVILTGGIKVTPVSQKDYAKEYDGNTNGITLAKETTLTFSGKLGADATGLSIADTPTGILADANAGDQKAVVVTATLTGDGSKDSTAWYELAPITFVTAKVAPKPLILAAKAINSSNYGATDRVFELTDESKSALNGVPAGQLEGTLKFDCPATETSPMGTYKITPYGLTSQNYAITCTAADLTVVAVNPTVEMVSADVVDDGDKRNLVLTGKLIDRGGDNTNTVAATFTYGGSNTVVNATLDKDGKIFTATVKDVQAGDYSVTAKATINSKDSENANTLKVSVSALTPQKIELANAFTELTYGNEMQLTGKSSVTGSDKPYTFTLVGTDGNELDGTALASAAVTISDKNVLKAVKAGKATIKIHRDADAVYAASDTYQTIEVTKKPLTVTVPDITREYTGNTEAAMPAASTLSGVITGDKVTLVTDGVKVNFANKNVGTWAISFPELELRGRR